MKTKAKCAINENTTEELFIFSCIEYFCASDVPYDTKVEVDVLSLCTQILSNYKHIKHIVCLKYA